MHAGKSDHCRAIRFAPSVHGYARCCEGDSAAGGKCVAPHDDDTRYSPGPTQSQIGSVFSSKGSLGGAAAVYQSVSVERDASFDLSIETADGDIATISFTQSQSFSAAGSTQRTGGGLALALQSSRSDNTDMQIAVTGELDAQELASISDLMKQVGGVAEDFFAGDMKQAIKAAAAIGIGGQSDTLSAFSFDLQRQEVRLGRDGLRKCCNRYRNRDRQPGSNPAPVAKRRCSSPGEQPQFLA